MELPTQVKLQTQDIANVLLIHIAGRVDSLTAKPFEDLLLPLLARLHWGNCRKCCWI